MRKNSFWLNENYYEAPQFQIKFEISKNIRTIYGIDRTFTLHHTFFME